MEIERYVPLKYYRIKIKDNITQILIFHFDIITVFFRKERKLYFLLLIFNILEYVLIEVMEEQNKGTILHRPFFQRLTFLYNIDFI